MNLENLIIALIVKLPLKLTQFNSKAYIQQLQENLDRCKNLHGLIVPCPLQFGAICPQYIAKSKENKDKVCYSCKLFGTETEEIACQSKKHRIKPFYETIRKVLIQNQ